DPRAILLALLTEHYRAHTDWTPGRLADAEKRLTSWLSWSQHTDSVGHSTEKTTPLLAELRAALADDLDAPAAIRAIDTHIAAGAAPTRVDLDAIDALLGIRL